MISTYEKSLPKQSGAFVLGHKESSETKAQALPQQGSGRLRALEQLAAEGKLQQDTITASMAALSHLVQKIVEDQHVGQRCVRR